MCRVRFGLTDVHFEELQPTFPRRAYYRASVAAVPGSGGSRLGPLIPIFGDEKPDVAKKEMVVSEPSLHKRGAASRLGWHINNNRKRSKRKDSANATSSKGLALSSQSSTSSSSSGDRAHNSHLAKPKKKNNPVSAFANCANKSYPAAASQQMHDQKKPLAAALSESSRKAPPAKRVRFAMDLKTAGPRSFPLYAKDDSSETHSSQESMIDPGPFPPYPVGGFGCPRPTGSAVSPCAGPSTGLVAGPKSGPTVGQNVEFMTELLIKSPTQRTNAQSTQTPQEWSPVLSHKSSNASLSETLDVYSGSYRALDAPRPYQKKKVPDAFLSAKSRSDQSDSKLDSFDVLKSAHIIKSGKPHQQENIQYKGTGTRASVSSSKSEAEEEIEVKTKEESVSESESESESETDDGVETDSDEGAQLVAQAVLLTRTNGELSVRPNKESRFAKLHPAKKLPKSILKASSRLFGAKGKAREKAKSMVARSPSVSAIDEEDESD